MAASDEDFAKELQRQFDEVRHFVFFLRQNIPRDVTRSNFSKEFKKEQEAQKFPSGIGDVVVKALIEVWNNRQFEIIDQIFAEDCVSKGSFGDTVGKKEFKDKVLVPLFNSFPDLKYP
jgi:hypothetical protein